MSGGDAGEAMMHACAGAAATICMTLPIPKMKTIRMLANKWLGYQGFMSCQILTILKDFSDTWQSHDVQKQRIPICLFRGSGISHI